MWYGSRALFSHILDVCNPSWRSTRDGLIIAEFIASILVTVSTMFLVMILCLRTRSLNKRAVRNNYICHAYMHFLAITGLSMHGFYFASYVCTVKLLMILTFYYDYKHH